MNHRNPNRRRFLGAALAGGAASHLLPFIPNAVRAAGASPKRLLVLFHPMGWLEGSFFPTLAANKIDFELGESLLPVAAHKNKLIFMDGLENRGGIWTYGFVNGKQLDNEHGLGMSAAFTGSRKDSSGTFAMSPSIDQVVAERLYAETPTKFRNIALGVNAGGPGAHTSTFFSAASTPVNPQNSAKAAFDTFFKDVQTGGGGGTPSADLVARARRQRQSVIDMVRAELNSLCGKIGQAEKDKCDAHLAALRQQENALAQLTVPVAATCTKPASPVTGSDLIANIHAQMDIVASAFTCDLTRVATIQMGGSDGGVDPPGFEHHNTTHAVGDTKLGAGPVANHKKIDLFFAARYAYLLNKLDSIQEADGTMLDNTLVLFGTCTTTGTIGEIGAHNATRFPFWMAGGGNFAFKTGRTLQYTTPALKKWVPHNRMLVSIAQKFGLAIDKFGTLDPGVGPLPML
jgi:Protein of unknown function (DUF1552)